MKIVLNKADSCSVVELNRVRGALMFNLGRILTFPEVPRVYIGSYWDGEVKNKEV
ncbi:MAG: hypothetical protein GY696_07565 [Gammaproteobacteria bacterium]|nr:hypothetical protein [Gammaproteobacteria bacterium]